MNASKVARRSVSVLVGLGVVVAWAGERVARHQAEHRAQEARSTQQSLERQLGTLQADRDHLSQALSVEQERVRQASASLFTKEGELQEVIERLSQEERVIQTLQEKLFVMQREFELLQGELAAALQTQTTQATPQPRSSSDPAARVQLEKVVVTHPASAGVGLQGRVISVHPEWRFVVIDLGWDVVQIGDIVSIYRNQELLGRARVERVQEQAAAATLLPEWANAEIQVNDVVRAL